MTVINPNSISGITSITLPSGDGNVLTIHTNDGTERFRIDSSGNVKVGSACTISPDGDVFFTGVTTATTFTGAHSGSGANLTSLPAAQLTGALPAISGANLTGIAATDNVRTGILDVAGVSTFRNTMNVGAAVTISESGIEASGIGITVANINGGQIGGRKNLIINGAMEIQQRSSGNYTTLTSGYTQIDRFHIYANPANQLTYEPSTDSPTGFSNSFKITSTSAYTPTSGNYFYFGQRIEGHNWKHLEYGTSNAKTITISFWVKSSITGTWSGIVKNSSQDRTFPWEYTISSADTWEKKSVTVIGCPDGTWATDTNDSAWIYFCMGSSTSGTTYLGSANSWQNQNLIGTTGSNSLPNTNGATWYMTGLQVELGTQMTEFEYRSFGEELALCQRYYFKFLEGTQKEIGAAWYYTGSHASFFFRFPVPMRAVPTGTDTTGTDYYTIYRNGSGDGINSVAFENGSTEQFSAYNSSQASGTAGQCGLLRSTNASAKIEFSAEI